MKKSSILILAASLPVWAAELPPAIPDGPISYDEVSYAQGAEMAEAVEAPAAPASFTEPVTPSASSEHKFQASFNVYSSEYQVRGMGFREGLTRWGWSSMSATYTPPNRNLFGRGIQQNFSGTLGVIWGKGQALGDIPVVKLHYGMGKEIFPNLLVEAGYTVHYGGMEGFAARFHGDSPHRLAQDLNLTISFDDHQRGFFGHAQWGLGFQGLTGSYFDFEVGYRFTDAYRGAKYNADLEVSLGIAPSMGYWGDNVEGIDACRIKVAFVPYTPGGGIGRDAAWQIKPWIQCSWSGNCARKIDRAYGYSPVDHFQIAIGLEANYRF